MLATVVLPSTDVLGPFMRRDSTSSDVLEASSGALLFSFPANLC